MKTDVKVNQREYVATHLRFHGQDWFPNGAIPADTVKQMYILKKERDTDLFV